MKTNYLALCAIAGLAASAACGKKDDDKKNAPPPPTPVSVVTARTTDAVYYDQYPATVVALKSVELRSQVTGFITALNFQEGDLVPAGKVLYEIDKRQFQGAYQQAVANLRSAQASAQNADVNKTRYQRLLQQDAVARQLAENAVTSASTAGSQVAAAQAAVSIARTNLAFATIKAPFAGRIGISQVRLGTQVSAGTTVLNTISTEDPIAVDFAVNETDISRFLTLQGKKGGVGDSILRFVLPNGQPYNQPGKIQTIDRGVDSQTGTITVRVQFANPQRQLKDGLSGVLKVLNTKSGSRLVIPNKAIVEQMGENFVYVARGDSAKQQKVQLGPRLRDEIVILDGIKNGDKIVTDGVQKLRDGGKIQISAPGAAVAAPAGPAAGK
ncbi:efflux RND transporter periplasmic adaptor subunit [Hymenobacter sp. UV11]|uniref:efflux RND transporter periplasmic adaptor subunit n=1 Tax=Hymenobacter sp. UV11 TaxID=1849735 RepID=UPI001060A964|nr:efflux RND transporter periplasmic adaptor subunit [Hymenobacter sp. UV11]TDN40537.1 efflux transporter periplasmic adaptor subunit [Hymenobacter sp. UV11]TFZ66447.1 efflux RND transporter periplasmic adaptor subunit [Hymenobacter sp. UV11]